MHGQKMIKGISRYSFWHSTYYDDTVECRHIFLSVTDVIILITEDDVIFKDPLINP